MKKYVVLGILLLGFFTNGRMVYAQTPTITPTPTPYKHTVKSLPFVYGVYLNSGNGWTTPAHVLGMPDGMLATRSAIGYAPLQVKFEVNDDYNWGDYGNIIGIKFDITGKTASNIVLFPENNFAAIPSCNAKTVPGGTDLLHRYLFFSNIECPGLSTAMFDNATFGYRITYYYGAQSMIGNLDSISYIPIFDGAPWDSTVKNTTDIPTIGSGGLGIPYENCDPNDFICNMRNWFLDTLVWLFGINTTVLQSQYDSLIATMATKKPFGYVAGLASVDFGSAFEASYSAIPDFHLEYANKYKAVDVFQTQINVSAATFAPVAPFIGKVRALFATILIVWLIIAWFRAALNLSGGGKKT